MTTASAIGDVFAWEALDSRGSPTVACEVRTCSGAVGQVHVPAGASTGTHEAHELRDGGDRYSGKGVDAAVNNIVTTLGPSVRGLPVDQQQAIDDRLRDLDGTPNLSRLGANAVLAVSLAARIAAAADAGVPLWRHALAIGQPVRLPMPMVNILSGGAHAGHSIDIQDVLVMPLGANDFRQAIEWVDRVRRQTAAVLSERRLPISLVADEGGYGPQLPTNETALEIVSEAIERAGFSAGQDVGIALDIAATQFYNTTTNRYVLASEGRELSAEEWTAEIEQWSRRFPIVSIEDALAEDDWDGWSQLNLTLGDRIQVLGDDLFTTNPQRLRRGISSDVANSVLVKPNQIGTVSEARSVVEIARSSQYGTVLSARSGDTEDNWLADLAVGWDTGQIKVGSLSRSERTAKWNRLLRLQAELGDTATFAGRSAIPPFQTATVTAQ